MVFFAGQDSVLGSGDRDEDEWDLLREHDARALICRFEVSSLSRKASGFWVRV